MSTSFLSLPSEIRNDIYERLLVLEDPISCLDTSWNRLLRYGAISTGILLANKAISREASSILYAQTHFDLSGGNMSQIISFINDIGRENASFMRHIIIDFPEFSALEMHRVALRDDAAGILDIFRERCRNLRTITTSAHSTSDIELDLGSLNCPEAVTEALALVNSRFRAVSSLEKVIVEVYERSASAYIRKEMEKIGWTVSEREQPNYPEGDFDSDRGWNDGDGYGSDGDYGFDDDSDEEYDIDNDSDFWRRAGD